jgi:hypothetical protein
LTTPPPWGDLCSALLFVAIFVYISSDSSLFLSCGEGGIVIARECHCSTLHPAVCHRYSNFYFIYIITGNMH